MGKADSEPRSIVYADIENLHRELEQLWQSLKSRPREQDRTDRPQPATVVFKGK